MVLGVINHVVVIVVIVAFFIRQQSFLLLDINIIPLAACILTQILVGPFRLTSRFA